MREQCYGAEESSVLVRHIPSRFVVVLVTRTAYIRVHCGERTKRFRIRAVAWSVCGEPATKESGSAAAGDD
ncbi:hypothetical protein E2C01_080005 [Portunus trituberculatus]|uniref:Uncharacterized protein n=1 Tax=Portunus trituberculatus TaxID=210409 RepID=A0A5B7IL10_PORTR|nr:hypothetical protein [Portunus trituberculatus]